MHLKHFNKRKFKTFKMRLRIDISFKFINFAKTGASAQINILIEYVFKNFTTWLDACPQK